MSPQFAEIRNALGPHLAGRTINLQGAGDDEFEVVACIVEVTFEGDDLIISTKDTRRKWRYEADFEPFEQHEFAGPFKDVRDAEIKSNGTIMFAPWGGYDYVYIRP